MIFLRRERERGESERAHECGCDFAIVWEKMMLEIEREEHRKKEKYLKQRREKEKSEDDWVRDKAAPYMCACEMRNREKVRRKME